MHADLLCRFDKRRDSSKEAVQNGQAIDAELSEHGFDQAALEQAAKQGYVNTSFEIDNDGLLDVAQEFYPMQTNDVSNSQQGNYQNELATHNVTSIEQGLRQGVMAVS